MITQRSTDTCACDLHDILVPAGAAGGNVVIVGSVVVASCNQGVHGVYILSMAHCSDAGT